MKDENKLYQLLSTSKVIKPTKISLGACTQLCMTSLKLQFQKKNPLKEKEGFQCIPVVS